MFFPTRDALAKASLLQAQVTRDESEKVGVEVYEPDAVSSAIVYTRQDMVMAVGLLTENHRQLVNISRAAWVAVALLVFAVAQLAGLADRM